jgi:hypothetical protein
LIRKKKASTQAIKLLMQASTTRKRRNTRNHRTLDKLIAQLLHMKVDRE